MEVVDIDLDTIPVDDKPVSFSIESDEKPSVSFGSGI